MVVQAMGGLMSVTGEPEGEPQKVFPHSLLLDWRRQTEYRHDGFQDPGSSQQRSGSGNGL